MLDWSLEAEDALLDNRYSLRVSLGGNGSKGWCGKFMSKRYAIRSYTFNIECVNWRSLWKVVGV